MNDKSPIILPALSIGLYTVSFFLTAYSTPKNEFEPGYGAFLSGMQALLWGFPGWLANPCYWVSLIYHHRRSWNAVSMFARGAVLLGLSHVLLIQLFFRLREGYLMWMLSLVILAISATWERDQEHPRHESE